MSLNKVMIIGNIGQDPEVNETSGGVKVAKITVATSERWKDKNGNAHELTEWHTVRIWKQNAEFIGKYGRKGSQVFVEGKLRTEAWEKDGQKYSRTLIEAENIQIIGNKTDGPDRSKAQSLNQAETNSLEPQPDDLPF